MKEQITRYLQDSSIAEDPAAVALAALPDGIDQNLFPQPLTQAAVLVPLVLHESGLSVLLTRRTGHLRDHPGQISFPGGRVESGDSSALATALRETEEEIGLSPQDIEIAGYLAPHAVITGFVVTPVVGFIKPDPELILDRFEVAEAFEVPLKFLLDPVNRRTDQRQIQGVEISTFQYLYQQHRIWGATAFMLRNLCKIVEITTK